MVRRWSYLNLINSTFSADHGDLAFVHHYATFKATTYYRKQIHSHSATKLARRAWSRRKHIHNWLIYQNLMSNWSQDYRFMRKYNRFTLALNVFKNSYLTYNLLMYARLTTTDFLGSEDVLVSGIIRRVVRYCSRLNPYYFRFFNTYRGVAWMYVTSNQTLEQVQEASKLTAETTHLLYQTDTFIEDSDVGNSIWLNALLGMMFNITLLKLVEFYKVMVLLTLTTLNS